MSKNIDLIELLAQVDQNSPSLSALLTKSLSLVIGVITTNDDPLNMRRVRVTTAATPGIDSYWLIRLGFTNEDVPVPPVGSTVGILFVEGDASTGCYLPLQNDTNPPLPKRTLSSRSYLTIQGDEEHIVEGGDFNVTAEEGLKLSTPNVSITFNPELNKLTFSAENIEFVGCSSVSILDKQILTIGSVDDDGDTNISKGW